ncbi:winged helix-turn-helix domain-containing protein [Paracoccus sp. PAR01]|uniref:winged helix-turn-helix domain-containing tetratricopeptide repeat protein n=1 Tax=Paracoccus sp. PAR01 TaxID=2769282 RepID=UPI00177D49A9|nr:winged helix-turn-helix domain-containing protein [Paracoccus sp. PAR01]MBD9526952.1 winged helix-turn-helix domain-containing protein [Paracoccus sp. PAR01]
MIWCCGDLRLDDQRFELLRGGQPVALEPQVFLVLCALMRAAGRLVSKDELIEAVWQGRAVSDASIASRIRAARAAIGDDGDSQRIISTVHGRGFRLLPPVTQATDGTPEPVQIPPRGRPSLAVLPFRPIALPPGQALLAEALAHEVLRALSLMRWMTVIARGSSFRFAGAGQDLKRIGEILAVRYILTGTLAVEGRLLAVSVELVEAATARLLWTERLARPLDELAGLQYAIVMAVASALELHVPLHEAKLAEGKDIERLDAWENYHLGLRQMFRFSAEGNQRAAGHFAEAVRLDPSFARAHAGLSFTSFQEAFLRYGPDRDAACARARAQAETSFDLDPMDPFAAFTLGRSFWLTDEMDSASGWLERATELNPNYAQGYYSRALTSVLMTQTQAASDEVEQALRLSPLDPLLYGMYGTRALSLIQQGAYDQAADWADRAASSPHAHFLIGMVAVSANHLAGREERALHWLRHTRAIRPDASAGLFFAAFPLRDTRTRARLEQVLTGYGFG